MENMDTNDALLVPGVNEDSVDIYDDLDINPSTGAKKSSANASPPKDSMDLYEEIITEEQQNKESSYTELMSRFQAAQNQIKELRKRLEQMEMQNTGLNTENYRLKKNLSALLITARNEVTRKDAEIQRLNQQSGKSHHPPHSHLKNLWAPSSSSQISTGSFKTKKPPPPPSSLPPPPPSGPPPPRPPLPASPPRDDRILQEPPPLSRKESNNSASQPTGSCIETRASKASSHSHLKGSSRGDGDSSDKQTEHSVRKSSSFSSVPHNESDKHKSKQRDEKCQSQKLSESTDRRHRTGSVSNKDCYAPEKNRSHKEDRDTGRRYDSRSSKSRKYLNEEGHHRSERSKSPLPESSHGAASSDDKRRRSRERAQDKGKVSASDLKHSSKESYSRDHRKIRTSDRHIRSVDSKGRKMSPSSQHAECHSDSSRERERNRLSKDYQKKGDRRHEDEPSRRHKSSTLSESSKESEKQRSKEADLGKVDVCSKERKEKTHEALKRSTAEQNIGEKSSVEENSPNRKLCFMETLNLTLSPIKKPVLPIDASQDDLTAVNKVTENRPGDEKRSESEEGLEQPRNVPKTPHSEKTHNRFDDAQEKGKNRSEIPASDKKLESHSGQTTSSHSKPPVTTENKMTVPHMQKSSESGSLKARNEDISETFEDRPRLTSDIQLDECKPPEAKDGVRNTSESISDQHKSSSLQKVNLGKNADQTVTVIEPTLLDSSVELKCGTFKTAVKKSLPVDSVEEDAAASSSREDPKDVPDKAGAQSQQISPTNLPQGSKEGLCSPGSSSIHEKVTCQMQDGPKDADAVSSTISLESLPQEGLSLPEAIYILTQANEDTNDCGSITSEPSSSTGCIAVSKVSSTTEETPLPEKYSDLTYTPKKSFSPGKSPKNNFEPSSSMSFLHDEDSMMRTLNNLKRIPDAISPLRSPIRIAKRSLLHVHGKPSHVKSLQKDFSSTAVDANSKKLDVNKENKYPGSPANHDPQNVVDRVSDLPSSLSDTELEEGEILSESEEMAAGSSAPATKKAKLARPVRSKQSPKTVLKRKSKERCVTSQEANETSGVSTRSPKSRFKTVCPAATKSSFSTTEEVMETFKLVRSEIRKKYMKLHKIFPKKSFYGVMDNFQESFLEFVDGACFGQICSQEEELKSKLRKLIASVFSKVSNNGIVRRIFEQQAVDLKQKLWDFVDGQVDYLFKDVYTTLKNLCKPTRAQAKDDRSSGNETISRQSPAKKPQCQQKEAQLAPTSMTRIKPCTVAPYKTGLGSRGKDIRITQMEKTSTVDPHPTNCPNTQTVVNFPSKNVHSTPEKNNISSLVVSQNSSLLDKTDFELLTEQQASSLTFNLVRDTQMGEIFKCLLQGSDLLETSGIAGDTNWSLGTPKKDGEKLISITTPTKFDTPSKLLSQTKFDTPSKLIATWSSISPRKMSSPRVKDQIQLNPALFDESCLLEVPSDKSNMASQRSYSILSEDLAVSLTIPSPLKSDSHLSFLQPPSMHIMSTPDSVISAHISEDALLDGEDATEQDIHLALDTDNSSCASSSSVDSEVLATPFVLKPDLPMQALVMERSNDHFIVKIRQAAKGPDTTLTAEDSLNETLKEEDQQQREYSAETQESQTKGVLSDKEQNSTRLNAVPSENTLQSDLVKSCHVICHVASSADNQLTENESLKLTKNPSHEKEDKSIQQNTSTVCFSEDSQKDLPKNLPTSLTDKSTQNSNQSIKQINRETSSEGVTLTPDERPSQTVHNEEDITTQQSPSKASLSKSDNSLHHPVQSSDTNQRSQVLVSDVSDTERGETAASDSERNVTTAKSDMSGTPEKGKKDCGKSNKRKKHHKKSKVKRPRMEEEESADEMVSNCKKKKDKEPKSSPASLSPNSLYARNVIRKKGEVVMSWTRDEDHAILTELKTSGASRETFSALSEKLNKPSEHIAERFYQLMKIFRKQEKMET